MAEVRITECGLHLSSGYAFWGDLWEEGDCWVFNACGDEEGGVDLDPKQKILIVHSDSYFQRRNVFVISKSNAILNPPAQRYLK